MQIKLIKGALTALAMSIVLLSCKKDKPAAPDCSISLNGLAGSYKLTKLEYKLTPTAPVQDFFQLMPDCEKDDVVTLKNNGTYTYADAGTVCNPNGNNGGNWSVNGNVINSDGTINGTISSYDCKTLVFYATGINLPGDKYTFTMVKQ